MLKSFYEKSIKVESQKFRVSIVAQSVKKLTCFLTHQEEVGSISGLAWWVRDLALPWLWRRLAAAALIQPLAWELRYTTLKKGEKKKKKSLYGKKLGKRLP